MRIKMAPAGAIFVSAFIWQIAEKRISATTYSA